MKLEKPSPGLIEEFRAVVAELRGAEPRKMFGYDAFFVNGNLAVGLWQNTCVFKLSKAHAEELLQVPGARPFAPMKGRVMTGWVEAPEEVSHDPEALREWCERALSFVRTLPPKRPKLSRKTASGRGPAKPARAPLPSKQKAALAKKKRGSAPARKK